MDSDIIPLLFVLCHDIKNNFNRENITFRVWTAQCIFEKGRPTKTAVPYPWVDYRNRIVYWPPTGKHISKYLKDWSNPGHDWKRYQLLETLLEYGTREEAEQMVEFQTTEEEKTDNECMYRYRL